MPPYPIVKKGFSLLEILFSLLLVALMTVLVVATLWATQRSNAQASSFLVARGLVTSKLSQLQAAGYSALNGPALGQGGARIVDGNPTSPTEAENASGAASATFEFTATNQLTQYFPASSQSDAPKGWIYISPYTPSKITLTSGDTYALIRATVQVQWRDTRGLLRSFSETTLIPRTAP